MRNFTLVIVLSAFWSGSAFSAQQVDLPLCVVGDGKTPVPRWEVVGAPLELLRSEKPNRSPILFLILLRPIKV